MISAMTMCSFGGPTATANHSLQMTVSETGIASYYGTKYHGKPTASGEVFDMNDLTAAHPKLAFGTRVKVTHLENNRSVIVRINDRGPFVQGRVIDLSQAAAAELQMVQSGLAQVKLEVLK
jgi:rare lipoprotein A